jgi:hypothetical protein
VVKPKKRVLFHSEASYLNTGYANYGKEIISRLIDTGKYEVAELSNYGTAEDARRRTIPWKNYPVAPSASDSDETKNYYNSNPVHQFGAWRFERACLDFKPDAFFSQMDSWMESWVRQSPYRPIISWAWASTVDGAPQNSEWINQFASTDYFYTLSDWGTKVIKEQGGDSINHVASVTACAPDCFKPSLNKTAHRIAMGIDPDWKIIGTVMRNQRRKLFPDLFEAFGKYLKETGAKDTYLYCHTSYPDNGWDIPQLLVRNEISSRVLFTYACNACGHIHTDRFVDTLVQCKKCKQFACKMSNVSVGASTEELSKIFQLFDVYFQCANCLTPGQGISTPTGWKNVEDIVIGDYALTHKNRWRKVVNTFEHDVHCPVVKFTTHSDNEELTTTLEHPLYVLAQADYKIGISRSFRETIGERINRGQTFEPAFVKAGNVKVGDLIAYAIDPTEEEYTIDLTDYIGDDYIIENGTYRYKCNGVEHPVKIKVDEDFAKWIGLYVADGCSIYSNTQGSVTITCNLDDTDNIELCKSVMSRFGNVSCNGYDGRHALDVMISNKVFADYLLDHCKKQAYKKLPDWSLKLPKTLQRLILSGLFMGDGCYYKKRHNSSYVTISKVLSEQIKQICRRLTFNYNLSFLMKDGNRKPQYRFEINGDMARGEVPTKTSSSRGLYHNGYAFYQIKTIEESIYEGKVHNFEVEEDNSYTGKMGTMHNSEGIGMPQIEAAACGIPMMSVDYSAMSDVVRKLGGYAVPLSAKTLEMETGCYRAIPDQDAILLYWKNFFSKSKDEQAAIGVETRQAYEANFNWDRVVASWMIALDDCPYADWNQPHRQINIPKEDKFPEFNNNKDFLDWCISTYMPYANLINSYEANNLLRDLNFQSARKNSFGYFYSETSYFDRVNYTPFYKNDVIAMMKSRATIFNFWENARIGNIKFPQENWL